MDTLDTLSSDEAHLVQMYREADRLTRARIMLATIPPKREPSPEEAQELEFYAVYLECSDYGRERVREAAQIFASSSSLEEAQARLAALDEARPTADVVDIGNWRRNPSE